jgi:hypothetical protein
MSPTQRTQRRLHALGYHVANTERKVPCTPAGYKGRLVTQDVWGIVDTWALGVDRDLLVQSTSGSNHNARIKKAKANLHLKRLLLRHDFEVWSWAKRGERGKRKLWTLRRTKIVLTGRHTLKAYECKGRNH